MSKSIIQLKSGIKLVNNPDLAPNLDNTEEIKEALSREGVYWLTTENHGQRIISLSDVLGVYVESDEVTVVGGGHKYVKLQHVQELLKLFERRSNIPDWEWEKFSKVNDKIKNTIEFLKRNAKTKEEL